LEKRRLKEIKRYGPDPSDEALQRLISHMDADDLSCCSPAEVLGHLNMSLALRPASPVKLQITRRDAEHFQIVIVAYDYFSEFALLCGLFSAFGLNIEAGNVQTLSRDAGRKKIVDLFSLRCLPGFHFESVEQQQFETEVQELIGLLEQGRFRAARTTVNQRLVSQLTRIEEGLPEAHQGLRGLLAPLEITFDNAHSAKWTRLNICGKDSPAFLYAFSSALAMRNIVIHKLKISRRHDQINNQIDISNRRGNKIREKKLQDAIRISAALTKQFVHDLRAAPDPAMAMVHFDQFLDKILETPSARPFLAFLKKQETLRFLARFFGTSHFLWEDFLRVHFDLLFPVLERVKGRPLAIKKTAMQARLRRRLRPAQDFESMRKRFNRYKDEEIFRIDLRHLPEAPEQLPSFSEALSDLAEVLLAAALKICKGDLEARFGRPLNENGDTSGFTILGLGKLGGRELGYASDIELLFIFGEEGQTNGPEVIDNRRYFEKLSQAICHFIEARQEGIFQIDTRLRPYGKSGALAISLDRFQKYYSAAGKAAPFERQALIKLRFVAGSRRLGRQCEAAREQFVYSGCDWDLKEAFALRMRQIKELVPTGQINVKYSPGGLVDIEYLVQYLQIMCGKECSSLRTGNTLEGLSALADAKLLKPQSARELKKAYLFLRALIDALRMLEGHAGDLLLPEAHSDAFIFLSRRMGYGRKNWQKGSKALEAAIKIHMEKAHREYRALFVEA